MMITLDPMELVATSETFRICSIEAADIGSQLWACAQCPMPSDIQGVVDQLVAAVDRALDSVAAQLLVQAIDLTKRAVIAITDSQASTLAVGTTAATGPVGAGGVTVSIGGWSPFDRMTITSGGVTTPASTHDALYGGTMTIGGTDPYGGITITNPDGTPVDDSTLLGTMSIGAPDYSGTMMESIMMFAALGQQHQQNAQSIINATLSNPYSSAAEIAIAFNAQDSLDDSAAHPLTPSLLDIERKEGFRPTISELKQWYPEFFLETPNIFDIY